MTLTTIELSKLGHAATPDSPLIFFLTLYFYFFWRGHENGGRGWILPGSVASAFAFLVKGPLGLLLPALVVGAYFLWHSEFRRVKDSRLIWATVIWSLIAVPWYVLVSAETKGDWPRAFFFYENLQRTTEPMERHSGPIYYYFIAICLFFAPWCSFFIATIRNSLLGCKRSNPDQRAYSLLGIWIMAFLTGFSIFATKLPHYIAPMYPALAILTSVLLVQWAQRKITMPKWAVLGGVLGFAATGIVFIAGFIIGSGEVDVGIDMKSMRTFPGLQNWAWIGIFPLAGAFLFALRTRQGRRAEAVISLAVTTVLLIGLIATWPMLVIEKRKAVRDLVEQSGARKLYQEVSIASMYYTQPTLTFYCGRRVERFNTPEEAIQFLSLPQDSFLFVPEETWLQYIKPKVSDKYRVVASQYDFYPNKVIVVVTAMNPEEKKSN